MITTDATYNVLIASGSYEENITGTLKDGSGTTVLNISNEYIKTGSLTIDNKCINNDDLEPGAVYAAELKITITGNAGLTSAQKSSLQNGSLNLTYTITDGNSSSSISIGIYYIIEVTLKDEDVEIIAEDMMSRLSKNIPTAVREDLNFVARTPYELLDLCCQNCSTSRRPIALVNDETEFDTWSNADASFLIPTTADIATYRDLVAEVAKIMGCFATIDKSTNGLILKRLNPHSNSNVWTLNEDIRYSTEKSGYVCLFGKVALGNVSYPTTSDEDVSGLILNMRATELTDDSELLPGIVQNLYTELSGISYRPCKIDFMGNIALEVGDWIGVNYTEDETTYTFRTIITHFTWILNGKELIESTGSSAATTKKVGSKGSGESRNSSSIDNLESRIETLESAQGGGNKIYTSKTAPDNTLGNEGDLWVKYHTENNDKFINSNNEEIDVNIPRYESDNEALSYVDTTIRPILRTIKDTSASQLSDIVKQFEKECTVVLYQKYFSSSVPGGAITISQFPQLVIDTYTVNNQSVSVIQGNTIVSFSGGTTVTSRAIGSNKSAIVNVDDFDGTLVKDGGNWYVIYNYLYYNTTTKYLNVIYGYLDINWYFHALPHDTLNTIVTNYSIDLADTSVMIIDEVYCKIGDDWVSYDGDGGSVVAVNQILQSGTEIAQISVDGEVVSIYAPTVSASQTQTSGTEIGTITVGDTSTKLYAPTTTVTQTLTEGTEIGEVNGTKLYAPSGGGGSSNLILDAQIYSLEEKQVGVWVDGKPLYQKTVIIDNITSLSASYNLGISNFDIVDIKTVWKRGRLNRWSTLDTIREAHYSQYQTYWQINDTGTMSLEFTNFQLSDIRISYAYVTILYTKTTDHAGSGGYQAYGFSPIIYSNEERVVGVWTDNKPLYQKTLNLTSPSEVFQGIDIADLTSLNIENLVKVEGFLYSATYSRTLPIYWSYAINNSDIRNSNWGTVYYENHSLKQNISSPAYTQCPVTITIQYTKTTDTPGSAPYVTSGAYAHHYSTAEQVVGTWIDGSTLYEKTYDLGSDLTLQESTWTDSGITAPTNANRCVKAEGIQSDGTSTCIMASITSTNITVQSTKNSGDSIRYLTIQYTKTS